MRPIWKWSLLSSALAAVILFGGVLYFIAPIGTAFVAKTICSGVFIAGRDEREIYDLDVVADNNPLLRFVSYAVDRAAAEVDARFLGMRARIARYREGAGCAVTFGNALGAMPTQLGAKFEPLPITDPARLGVDAREINQIVRSAFDEPNLSRLRRTHAVLVLYRGKLIAEHYAAGFEPDTPHVGWSMSKTVTALLVGRRIAEGKLRLDQTDLWPGWHADGRSAISLANLLQMNSGLAFDENYDNPRSDVVRMLNESADFAGYALRLPQVAPPGAEFHYSSGTTLILSKVLRRSFDGDDNAYWTYPREALFKPLGIGTATFEVDASGTLVGASSMYAGAHDWARIGLLLLDGGRWQGREVVPESWIRFLSTPAPSARNKEYGAHIWTSVTPPFIRDRGVRPQLPPDAVHMTGFDGQFVSVVPSHQLVVVRLGLSRLDYSWDHEGFMDQVLRALPRG